jgi:hypothetical protein
MTPAGGSIDLETKGKHLVLKIQGGDASTSYNAEIIFDSFVRRKIVRHMEFPCDVWDETTYQVNELEGI